ncbi:hypothetical protein MNB_SUP05-SYMBIONT-4-1213 [hydrothermal vent metagenome]|uniref:Uncharacterized protein n=1 Tax=hydrothermal vent metagenome TaxID=652676 RepID=A0A1W1DVX5_9ZZZZ
MSRYQRHHDRRTHGKSRVLLQSQPWQTDTLYQMLDAGMDLR